MQAFDHAALQDRDATAACGSRLPGTEQLAGCFRLRFRDAEDFVADVDLSRMNEALAVESQCLALLTGKAKA